MADQLDKLVAETPQENVRSPKPQIEDFTEYGEDGKKVVNISGYQDSFDRLARTRKRNHQ